MEDLVDLFKIAYTSHSNHELAEATREIESRYPNQLFYDACLQIIFEQNSQISSSIKSEALINFKNGIKACWKSFDENIKMYLLSQIPELIANVPIGLLPTCEKLSDEIIVYSFIEDECPNLIEILPQLFQSEAKYLRPALIISKSVCRKIKNPDDKNLQVFSEFAPHIFPLLAALCKECDDLLLLNYCYHCLSRLLFNLNEITEQLLQSHGEVCYGKFMSLALNPPEQIDEKFVKFLIEGVKFLNRISEKLSNEQFENIFQLINIVFQFPSSQGKIKAKIMSLLNTIVIENKRYDVFESHMQLIMEIIFSQLMITNEDIENMENDPEAFIQANPQANYKWEEDKSSYCHLVSNCVKIVKDKTLIDFIYQIVSSSFSQSNSRNQIFTAFRLLTTAVSKRCKEHFDQFLPSLIESFDNSDFVIRSGAFLLLSTVECCNITQQIIDCCINHLNDPAQIVRYYAALALSQSFYLCQDQQEHQQYKELYSPGIGDLLTSLIDIYSQFNDSYISDTFIQFINFFKEEIIPCAMPLFDKILEFFVKSCISGESRFSSIEETSSSALLIIINLIGKNESKNPSSLIEYYGHFYSKLCSAIEETNECESVASLIPPLSALINLSPGFNPDFWELFEPLMALTSNDIIIIDDSGPVIEQLIFKDNELATREQIVTNLCSMILSDGLTATPTICASLIMRIGSSLPCMSEIISYIKKEAVESEKEGGFYKLESICNVVSAIFIKVDDFSELFEEGNMSLFNIWIKEHSFPFYIASLLNVFDKFSGEVEAQAQMLRSGFESISVGLGGDEEEDELLIGDDDEEDEDDKLYVKNQAKPGDFGLTKVESPQWFNEKDLAQKFLKLVSGLIEAQSPIVQAFGQEELIEEMNKFA